MDLKQLTEQVSALSREVAAFIRMESTRITDASVESKSLNNLVSYVDKHAEQAFVDGLRKLLPQAGFIAEEGTGEQAEGLNWVIDPLDGTTNFVHGIPCYCTSVALIDSEEILLGVVLEVTRDECFAAWKGGGAYLNGRRIQVSTRGRLQDGLLATGFPYDDFAYEAAYMDLLRDLMHRSRGIRRLGSAAADLAYVACGRFEAFYEYGLNAWDVAAGILLVQEAGGTVSDFKQGADYLFGEEIIASNGHIHQELLDVIERSFSPLDQS
ncbi:MAG: inositol monophosphatase [Bacteroidetes bacterium]|nr:inositol monophosphatase [Bacteroidota bacterium]